MIRKVDIQELEKGMYISGFEKEGTDKALFFMNNILVKNKKDLDDFQRYGYRSAYIVVDEPFARPPVPSSDMPVEPKADLSSLDPSAHNNAADTDQPATESCGTCAPSPTQPGVKMPPKLGLVQKRDKKEDDIKADSGAQEQHAEERGAEPSRKVEPPHLVEHTRVTEAETENNFEPYDTKRDVEIVDTLKFDEEIEAATVIRNEAEELVREFMGNVVMGTAIKPEKIHKTVDSVIDSAFRNQDAITSLTRLKNVDEYTFGHCVNVCILSVAIARRMGFDKDALHNLGVGALLHDVGKALVPEDILKKEGPLSDTEFDNMKKHTTLGIEYLKSMPEISRSSMHVVAQHHEKFNGTGYPYSKEGDRIHIFARIAAVADVYDAMTSTRCYQKGMLPDIALQKIYMLREKQFEPILVERLIKCLGIYPIGTVVELNTGEIAVVKGTNHANPLQPKISMLINAAGRRFKKAFSIDLKNASSKWVVSSKDPESIGLDIDDIIA